MINQRDWCHWWNLRSLVKRTPFKAYINQWSFNKENRTVLLLQGDATPTYSTSVPLPTHHTGACNPDWKSLIARVRLGRCYTPDHIKRPNSMHEPPSGCVDICIKTGGIGRIKSIYQCGSNYNSQGPSVLHRESEQNLWAWICQLCFHTRVPDNYCYIYAE